MPTLTQKTYLMCLAWYNEIQTLAYKSQLEELSNENEWRRPFVEDVYHGLRAQGTDHEQAIHEMLLAIPFLKPDPEGVGAILDMPRPSSPRPSSPGPSSPD